MRRKMILTILCVTALGTTSCRNEPKISPCSYTGKSVVNCIPLNQPKKSNFTREMEAWDDLVISSEDWAENVKHHKDLHQELDACK